MLDWLAPCAAYLEASFDRSLRFDWIAAIADTVSNLCNILNNDSYLDEQILDLYLDLDQKLKR